jgi:hypothetical protein
MSNDATLDIDHNTTQALGPFPAKTALFERTKPLYLFFMSHPAPAQTNRWEN